MNEKEEESKKMKKKITPLQIAFLVERYLADNGYTDTLSSFRSEASDLYSKTKGKDAPKGLLGLAEILEEYIALKEQKVMVDQQKKRVDLLLQGIHNSLSLYHHHHNPNNNNTSIISSPNPSPPLPLPPPPLPTVMMTSTSTTNGTTHLSTVHHFRTNSNTVINGPSPGHVVMKPHPALSYNPMDGTNFSTPTSYSSTSSSRRKRKVFRQLPAAPPAPKKIRAPPSEMPLVGGGIRLPSQVAITDSAPEAAAEEIRVATVEPSPCNNELTTQSPAEVSSVAKSLFKMPGDSQHGKFPSPKTPQQESPLQSGGSGSTSPEQEPSQQPQPTAASQEDTPSKCSVITSKKVLVISPFKQSGYYCVATSHRISTSPLKSTPSKINNAKRDSVKSRLDFDSEVLGFSPDNCAEVHASTSSSDDDKMSDDIFDIGFLDPEGDFNLSQFLEDFDLPSDINMPSASCGTQLTEWPTQMHDETENGFPATNEGCSSHEVTEVHANKEMNICVSGPDSIKSMKKTTAKSITVIDS